MPTKTQTFFLEQWLKTNSGTTPPPPPPSQSSSARAIIQSWSELRDSLQSQSFQPHHLGALQTLVNSQTSLHVADPQAKLLISILSSPTLSPPLESYPLFLKLLYIWLRKSNKPFASHVENATDVVMRIVTTQKRDCLVVSHGVLLLGAILATPILSDKLRKTCLQVMCKLVEEEERELVGSCQGFFPEVIAGIGYALSSCDVVYFPRILSSLFGIWSGGGALSHALMILHVFEWVLSGFIASRSKQKIECICSEILGFCKLGDVPFAKVMATSGALRGLNRIGANYSRLGVSQHLKISLEECIKSIARDLVNKTGNISSLGDDRGDRLVLQCIAVGVTRSGLTSYGAPLVSCLVTALLVDIFPLRSFYTRIIQHPYGNSFEIGATEVREHVNSVLFKEAGSITRTFCNQYVSADEQNKRMVENFVWGYCQDLYSGHTRVALLLQGSGKELLDELEKIAEACFLMIVIFASVVTKHILNTNCSPDLKAEVSVRILISFSCVEYFRRVRLPEYSDTIRGVVTSVQENESSCVSFIESIPSYSNLTKDPGMAFQIIHAHYKYALQGLLLVSSASHSVKSELCLLVGSLGLGKEYAWSKNDVQTARILFYLRVIPTCIERVPTTIFGSLVASTMFLYMGHPNAKIARASHSVFVAFVASGKDSNMDDRELLKEQLVFYYMQRALEGYPGITPFEGLASGVVSLVRHLPAGSPATFYCISSLVERAQTLCGKAAAEDTDIWKNWQGDSESNKKLVELLLRLLTLVDIQVLPNLMRVLSQFIVQLPRDGQNMVLDEIYSLVAESDDVTRKPSLVSWLQSLSFLCSQTTKTNLTTTSTEGVDVFAGHTDNLTTNRISACL